MPGVVDAAAQATSPAGGAEARAQVADAAVQATLPARGAATQCAADMEDMVV